MTTPATADGTLQALRFAATLDSEGGWAVEDCRHVSGRLERELLASGDRVVRVAPGLTETSRRAARQPGKSDPIDATAIARAALREGIDSLPVAFLDEQAHEIRLLNDYRRQLVSERVRLINPAALAPGADRTGDRGADQASRSARPADPREGRSPACPPAAQHAAAGR